MPHIQAIAGYASFGTSDPQAGRRALTRMGARLCADLRTGQDHALSTHEFLLFDGRFGIAAVAESGLSAADVASELAIDGGIAAAAVGNVWSVRPAGDRNSRPCAAVIRDHVAGIGPDPEALNGVYSAVAYDDRQRSVRMYSDRLGLLPLYYAFGSERFVFGSSIQSLLEHDTVRRTLSEEVLGQLLYLGFLASDETYVRGVHRLPSGSIVSADANGVATQRYWTFRYHTDHHAGVLEDRAEECYQLLRAAARRVVTAPETTGVLLSGGLDSRATLGTLVHEFGPRFISRTYGLTETEDTRTARQVAKALNCPHDMLPLRGDALLVDLLNLMVTSGFMVESRNAQVVEVLRLTRPIASHWFSGGFLDATFGGYWLPDEPSGGTPLGREAILAYGPPPDRFEAVVGRRFSNIAQESVVAGWRASCATFSETTPENALERFMIAYRHRGYYAASHALCHPGEQRFLMCDYDLFDFFLRLPVGMRRHKKLYVHMLRTKWPELSNINYSNTGAPVGEAASATYLARKRRSRSVRRLARRFGLGRLLGPSPYVSADKAFSFWQHPDIRPFVEAVLLSPRALSRPHVNPDGVRQLVSTLSGSASGLRLLFRLLRTELLIRSSVEGDAEIFREWGLAWHAERPVSAEEARSAPVAPAEVLTRP